MSALEGQYFGDSEGERAVLYMDTVSDNSVTPLCPINGMYMCTINVHALCGICGLANIQFLLYIRMYILMSLRYVESLS